MALLQVAFDPVYDKFEPARVTRPAGSANARRARARAAHEAPTEALCRAVQAIIDAAPDALVASRVDGSHGAAGVWQSFLDGRLKAVSSGISGTRAWLLGRLDGPGEPRPRFCDTEAPVLVRVLCGDQQKAVALDLGVACSTASKWQAQALDEIHWSGGTLPLPFVLAAQCWAGAADVAAAAQVVFPFEGRFYSLLSVPRPRIRPESDPRARPLTGAERDVACMLLEGESRWTIAARRTTSHQTIACQLRNIFSKHRVRGRYALIRRGAGLGWFT